MLIFAIILFILTAVFGLQLFLAVFRNEKTPKKFVVFHGSFAFIALLVFVAYIASGHYDKLLIISFALFILAAIGGFTMFTFDMNKKPIPKLIAMIHPVFALTALVILIIYVIK